MMLRLAAVMSLLLLTGCHTSGYTPGHSASDYPAEVKLVQLDKLAPVETSHRNRETPDAPDPGPPAGSAPSAGTLEVLALFKSTMIDQFKRQGITLVENPAGRPDLSIQVIVDYTPEMGLYVHRTIIADMHILAADGHEIRKESYVDANNFFGVISSMVQSRDDMVAIAARKLVDQAVAEFRKKRTTLGNPTAELALGSR